MIQLLNFRPRILFGCNRIFLALSLKGLQGLFQIELGLCGVADLLHAGSSLKGQSPFDLRLLGLIHNLFDSLSALIKVIFVHVYFRK